MRNFNKFICHFLIVTLFSLNVFGGFLLLQKMVEIKLLKEQIFLHETKLTELTAKLDNLKAMLIESAARPAPISLTPPVEGSDMVVIVLTVFVMCGVFLFYYYTSVVPLFCPVRTMSNFDSLGNQIILGIRYPVDSPVSASIRLVGTPDAIPIARFAKTILENPHLKQTAVNDIVPAVLKNGITVFESCKSFLLSIVHIFF